MLSEHKYVFVTMCVEEKEWLLHGHWPIQPSLKLFLQLTVLESATAEWPKVSHTNVPNSREAVRLYPASPNFPSPLALTASHTPSPSSTSTSTIWWGMSGNVSPWMFAFNVNIIQNAINNCIHPDIHGVGLSTRGFGRYLCCPPNIV